MPTSYLIFSTIIFQASACMLRVLVLFVNLGSINGLGMSEDEDDNNKDVDDSDDQEVTLGERQNGTTDSNYDDHDSSSGDDNDDDDDDSSGNEKDSVHLASDNKSGEDYNSSTTEDDLDTSGNEDNDDDDGVDDEDLGDDAIQSFSATSLKEDLEKGKAAKNQLSKFLMK